MEERNAGGSNTNKDKKYVLYTVVGDDRTRTTPGSWALRILLGSLMVVALAVVPYVSLRIAQANSRTLVVFQPVPIHNRSSSHHPTHRSSSVRSKTIRLMEVANLRLDNYTAHNKLNTTAKYNETETIDLPANLTSTTVFANLSIEVETVPAGGSKNETTNLDTSPATEVPDEKITSTRTSHDKTEIETPANVQSKSDSSKNPPTTKVFKSTKPPLVLKSLESKFLSSDKSTLSTGSTVVVKEKTTTTPASKQTTDPPKRKDKSVDPHRQKTLAHKLVYVATSSSGNHVGGICVWKTDKNVTNWSYFYDNIPIEYQSGHDAGDHEVRTTLAAVRTWSNMWKNAHVTLRSQHSAIEHSDLPVRATLVEELEKASIGHFTYELEWRLPEADSLVRIANSLSRLHQDYKFWFDDFKKHVNNLLGEQDWDMALKDKHIKMNDELFFTEESSVAVVEKPDKAITSVTLDSSGPNSSVTSPKPLLHKLVYVATSASGNHVGGFCMWKVDKNVTDWSYFYDNIPVEYQSNHDSADHEQRATLAALRIWGEKWQDAHVTLRSQHAALDRSDGVVKKVLLESLDKMSEGRFTYDLEWRLRKSDDLVKVSYSLSRLHRNFGHWFAVFKASVDDILGAQDWDSVTKSKRVMLTDQHFFTDEAQSEVSDNSLKSTLAELGQ